MKLTKKLLVVVMAAMLLLGVFTPVAFADEKPGYAAYDPDKALSYASKHWNDGVGECAEFVSQCLKAGGIQFSKETDKAGGRLSNGIYKGCYGLYYDLSARSFVTVSVLKSYKNTHRWADNSGKIAPGDVVFWHIKGTDRYTHVVIISQNKKDDTIRVYQHNPGRDGSHPLYTQSNIEMVVVHFKGYMEYCTSYATHGSIQLTKATDLMTYPCSTKCYAKSSSYKKLQTGAQLETIGVCKNTAGEYYYKVLYNGKTLYVNSKNSKWTCWRSDDISVKNISVPSGTVNAGKDVTIKGDVIAKYNRLIQISGFIKQGNNSSAKTVASEITNLNSVASVSIEKTDLKKLNVSRVKACGTYMYVIKVICCYYSVENGKLKKHIFNESTVYSSEFKVK